MKDFAACDQWSWDISGATIAIGSQPVLVLIPSLISDGLLTGHHRQLRHAGRERGDGDHLAGLLGPREGRVRPLGLLLCQPLRQPERPRLVLREGQDGVSEGVSE